MHQLLTNSSLSRVKTSSQRIEISEGGAEIANEWIGDCWEGVRGARDCAGESGDELGS